VAQLKPRLPFPPDWFAEATAWIKPLRDAECPHDLRAKHNDMQPGPPN
jgi:hypothetical protein